MQALIGTSIGAYRLERELGRGGMGAVYQAVDPRDGHRVAIKVLHADLAQDPECVQRLGHEARATNQIDHLGIVKIHEFGALPAGGAFLVMEHLDGESLRARLQREVRLPVAAVLRLGQQLASSLSEAHHRGIVHRDLKPDNVMIVPDLAVSGGERTKLLDFGIAKLLAESEPGQRWRTQTGMTLGTPAYMAPEHCRETRDAKDPADVYSLGVMLYEMLAGTVPFEADTPLKVMFRHLEEEPRPLRELNAVVPRPLCATIHAMLAKATTDRPTMAQVAEALSTRDGALGVNQTQLLVPALRRTKRWRWPLALGLAGLLVVGGAAGSVLRLRDQPPLPVSGAARPPAVGRPALEVTPLPGGAPSGRREDGARAADPAMPSPEAKRGGSAQGHRRAAGSPRRPRVTQGSDAAGARAAVSPAISAALPAGASAGPAAAPSPPLHDSAGAAPPERAQAKPPYQVH